MKTKTGRSKGITLVALVITIIVMLILVGVTLSITLDENGIIENTKLAAARQEEEAVKEQLQALIAGEAIENLKIPDAGSIIVNGKTYTFTATESEGAITVNVTGENFSESYSLVNDLKVTGITGIKPSQQQGSTRTPLTQINDGDAWVDVTFSSTVLSNAGIIIPTSVLTEDGTTTVLLEGEIGKIGSKDNFSFSYGEDAAGCYYFCFMDDTTESFYMACFYEGGGSYRSEDWEFTFEESGKLYKDINDNGFVAVTEDDLNNIHFSGIIETDGKTQDSEEKRFYYPIPAGIAAFFSGTVN